MEQETIKLNFPPQAIAQYVAKWLESVEKDKKSEKAAIAMAHDIQTLVGIACRVLVPQSKEAKKASKITADSLAGKLKKS